MNVENIQEERCSIRTKDGVSISCTLFVPWELNRSLVVIGSSAAVNQSFYVNFSRYLANRGYVVATFDYRGVGASLIAPPPKLSDWALFDLDAILLYLKNKFVGFEIIYLGHQIGGEIIGLVPSIQFIHRIVLVSSGLSSRQFWPVLTKLQVLTYQLSRPLIDLLKRLFPYHQFHFLYHLPKGVVQEWARSCKHKNGLYETISEKNHHLFRGYVLAYSFSDDSWANDRAVRALLKQFPNASIQHHHFRPTLLGFRSIKHLGFFKAKARKELWPSLLQWLMTEPH